MINLAYITHTGVSVTETFIYDNIKGLSSEKNINLSLYSGKSNSNSDHLSDIDVNFTGYAQKGEKLSYLAFKLFRILGLEIGYKMKAAVQKYFSHKALKQHLKKSTDVAFIDYANSAILVREVLEEKKIPYIVHVHGYDITSSLTDPQYQKDLAKVLLNASFLIAASHHMKSLLVLLGASEEKIRVIRYGVDVDSITPILWEERVSKKPSVIFLGRLTSKKHPIALLYAFKEVLEKIPDCSLTIIGDGPLENKVLELVKKLNIESSVNLLGSLPREKSFPIMNKHWVYAQHSVTSDSGDQEGYAISPAEAAAHELPVVSTIHNGIPEHVLDGVTGFLVPEYNYKMMAEKIIYLINNPDIAENFGKSGRKNIKKINDGKVRTFELKNLLQSLVVKSS